LEQEIKVKLDEGLKKGNWFKTTLKALVKPPQKEYEIDIINNFVKTSIING